MFSDESVAEEDDTFLDSSQSSLKRGFFSVLAPLISEEYLNYLIKVVIILIETFQYISLAFEDVLIPLWKSSSSVDFIASFFNYFMFMPYLRFASFSFYLTVFYLLSALNFLIFALFVYENCKTRGDFKRNSSVSAQILKLFLEISPQILYMPIFETFLAIFNCSFDESQAKWTHNTFTGTVCFENSYILHVFVAGLAIILTFCLNFLINLLHFDNRLNSSNFLRKIHGKIDIYCFFYKTIAVITFVSIAKYSDFLLLLLLTVPPFVIFLSFLEIMPYFNVFAFKLHLLQYSLLTWTGFMLIFAKITFETTFDASLFVYFFGIALLFLIVFMRKEFRYEILLVNVEKTDSIEVFLRHVHYLLLLCENYKQDHGMAVLLDGYIQYHKTICQAEDCFSRKDFKSSKKIQKILDFGYDEQILRVTYMINSYFTVMLQKKPYNSTLRVQYALFLLDKINQKQLALQELAAAAAYKPSFSEQFSIFRLKKIIENELLDKKKEEKVLGLGYDAINELALNSLVRSIKNNIEKAAALHLEFWSQLSEDVPDLSKLFEIGHRINATVTVLEEDWERLQRMNVVLPSLYRNYAGFLYSVLNDKPASVRIYGKIEAQNLQGVQQNSLKTTVVSEYVNNSTPVVFISGEEATLGNILSLNQTAAALLGYSKSELVNKKINVIQPNSIAQSHDQYIESFLLRNETKLLNKETLLPVKNRNGFLCPLYFFPRFVPFALQGLQFFAILRPEKTFRNYLYLFCGRDGSIELISSSCVGVLAVDKKKLSKRKHDITQVIPSFFDKLASFQGKNGGFADVHVQSRVGNNTISQYTTTLAASLHVKKEAQGENNSAEDSQILSSNELSNVNIEEDDAINKSNSNINVNNSNNPNNSNNILLYATNTISRNENAAAPKKTRKGKDEETVIPCTLPVNVFTFQNKDFGLLSYLVRIEYKEQPSAFRKKNPQQLQAPDTKNLRNPYVFSLLFDVSSQCYKGELLEGQDLEIDEYLNQLKSSYSNRNYDVNASSFPDDFRVSSDIRNENLNKNSLIYKKFEENMLLKQKELQNSNYEFIDFGKGIRTYRLLGDRAYDVEELKREEEEENSEEIVSEKNENPENSQRTHKEKDEETSVETNANLKNSRNIFRSRGNFFAFLRKAKSEKNYFVNYLQLVSVIVLVLLGVLASVNHFMVANQNETNQTSYNLIEWSNQRISQAQMVLFYSMELFLLNRGLYAKNSHFSDENLFRNSLNSSIFLLEKLQNQIILNSFGLNSAHKRLVLENSINVKYLSANGNVLNQSFDINQITSQIISKAYSLVSKALNCFNTSDGDFFYLQYNLVNEYYLALRQENTYFIQELEDRFSGNSIIILVMISLSAILLAFSLGILTPLYVLALNIHHKILMIFLEISPDLNKKILTKTEGFINHLQIGESEEEILTNHSSEKSIAGNEEDSEEFGKKKRRKKFKFNNFAKFFFVFKLFFISFAIEAFFLGNFFVTTYYLQSLENLTQEINVTSVSESYFSFANNVLRQNIIQRDFSVVNLQDSSEFVGNLSTSLIGLASEIEKQHSLSQNYQDPAYNSVFNEIFSLNLCDFFVGQSIFPADSKASCENFADGSLTQGLSLSFYRFIDNFRDLTAFISLIRSGELTDFSEISPNISEFYVDLPGISSKTENNLMNLLNLPQQEENNNLTNVYLVDSLRFLMQMQLDTLKQSYTNTMNSRLILYICFIIFLFIVYLFFWMPIIYQLNNNLYKIKRMLSIIPIEIINSNGNIKESIEFFLNIHE